MSQTRTFAVSWLLMTGCHLQTTTGPMWVGHENSAWIGDVELGTHAQRKSSAVVAARLGTRVDDGLVIKQGMLHGGYDFVAIPGWLMFEVGPDFGAGQPLTPVFDGTGAYAGLSGSVRFRPTPGGDKQPGFNIAFPLVEIVAMPRFGLWMPPEHSNTTAPYFDRGIEFGLRFGLGSDIFSPAQGRISDGGTSRPAGSDSPGGKQVMKRLRPLLVFLVAVVTLACHNRSPVVPERHPVPSDSQDASRFVAGTAIADITPPLHLSLFGHGPESRVATGVRLRLRCQVFVIASGGSVLALIPCDLQSSSAALHRGIAKRLRDFGIPITADRVYLMANHTHAAPAHYFEARRYSGTFSSSIPGYDQEVVDFLSEGISEAVVRAYASAAPACIGWKTKPLRGFTFNRAYVPFLANKRIGSVGKRVAEAEKAETVSANTLSAAEEAVDHGLFVMRIDSRGPGRASCDASGPPLGVLAVYGMHPTGIPNTNELYHGDIFGFATRTAAACLRSASPRLGRDPGSTALSLDQGVTACDDNGASTEGVVVGLANGVEGDVSPKLPFQSVPNARALGRQLGIEIARTAADIEKTEAAGPVRRAYWELWFPGAWSDTNPEHRLCKTADLGMAAAGGVHDGPTRLRVIPEANGGYRLDEPYGCQGRKLAARLGFGPSAYDYPQFGAISLLEVGDARLVTVPAEPTTATGLRIRDALDGWSKKRKGEDVAVVGLTNHYLQYIATKEEYGFQYYEGASTLYGPDSSQFLVRSFGCLAKWMTGKKPDGCAGPRKINQVGDFDSSPDPVVTRYPPAEELTPLTLVDVPVSMSWPDGDRGWQMTFPRMPLDFTADRLKFKIEVLEGRAENVVDDDRGSSIEVREVEQGESWRVRWTPVLPRQKGRGERSFEGPGKEHCGRWYRLAVRGRFRITSQPFQVTCQEGRGEP